MHINQLREHVARILADQKIQVHPAKNSLDMAADSYHRSLKLAPIRNAGDYAVALHEIGHLQERPKPEDLASDIRMLKLVGSVLPSPRQLGYETRAWEWAKANALEWTREMESALQLGLCSHLNANAEAAKRGFVAELPADHPARKLAGNCKVALRRMEEIANAS